MDFVWLNLGMKQIPPGACSHSTGNLSGRSNQDQGPGRARDSQEDLCREQVSGEGEGAEWKLSMVAPYLLCLLRTHSCGPEKV